VPLRVRLFESRDHEEADSRSGRDIENFEKNIVERRCKKVLIAITSDKHDEIENLGFERKAVTGAGAQHFVEKNADRNQVTEVS
jgi:hypothetical protein